MEVFKKIWHWLFGKKEVESYEDYKAKCLKDAPVIYNTGGYIAPDMKYSVVGIVHTGQTVDYNTYLRQRQVRIDSDDNYLLGGMVGFVVADSLNDNSSARDIEVPKSSNYESSYTPSSPSSYDIGSYSSSSDLGSSSSSCDSGC